MVRNRCTKMKDEELSGRESKTENCKEVRPYETRPKSRNSSFIVEQFFRWEEPRNQFISCWVDK